jgi:sterol-4alpha-carboxylate 3-dehydrogenase (decarboxylating)
LKIDKNGINRCLVIGGAGMLGYEIASQLANEGKSVRLLDLKKVGEARFESIVGDISNIGDVNRSCNGIDTVFQTAAAVWDLNTPEKIFDEVNIEGNRNVIKVCKKLGVPRLVYTSTMDVVVDGSKPIVYGDESLPYPKKVPKEPYSRTKIIAEQLMLKANGPDLLTTVLRPAGMYGPRDKLHIASIIELAKSKMNFRLGDGSACFSHVYSENVAHAHILAAKHLKPGSPVAGQCYFITDHQPAQNLFDFMEPFLRELGLHIPKRYIPYRLALFIGLLSEIFTPRSKINRFTVNQVCVDHTFVHDRAEKDFGYKPIVSKEEAFRRTVEWFKSNI